jgi:GNAT superfamily N-acetyltransferase
MSARVQIKTLNGSEAESYLDDLARLRIAVFRDFPYLYDGDLNYERKYLATYFRSPDARVVLCLDGAKVVGASTVVPLAHEDDAFQRPFREAGHAVNEVMYFGESVLLSDYRGLGVGKRFFAERLKHAIATPGIKRAAFCAVVRSAHDPLRPAGHRPLDGLWQSFGFHPALGLECQLSWKQINEPQESLKTLQFWIREL